MADNGWMMMLKLDRRELLGELMDDPALPEAEHAGALRGLRRINAVSRTAGSLFGALVGVMGADPNRPRRVLDVACGDGDNTVGLARLAARRGLPWTVAGCDISPRAVGYARALAARRGVEASFFEADALSDLETQGYDAVVNTLFLHHLEDDQIVRLLTRLRDVRHVVISDLVRSRFAYAMTCVGVRLLSRSSVVHVDGPLSVRAALTLGEMRGLIDRAGVRGARITPTWPLRQLVVWGGS